MFDEMFRPGGGEDYDVLARAYQAGYRMVAYSGSMVWHKWSTSKADLSAVITALPQTGPAWNKMSTKGFGDEGLWHPDVNQWGQDCKRTRDWIYRAPL
jgi:hypothetical protein